MSLTAGHGARLPSVGDFWLAWTDGAGTFRLFKVTARSTDTLTVVADSSEGSGDGNISSAETLRWVLSRAALDQLRADLYREMTAAAFDSLGSNEYKDGDEIKLTDSIYTVKRVGGAWSYFYKGMRVTPPPAASNWTAINGGSSTLTDVGKALRLNEPATGSVNYRIWKKAAPSAPYAIKALVIMRASLADYIGAGIGFRQSSDGKLHLLTRQTSGVTQIYSQKWTDPTTFSADYSSKYEMPAREIWLKIEDDNTNRKTHFGDNEADLEQLSTVGRTDFLTANEVCIAVKAQNASADVQMTVVSWEVT